MKAGKKRSTDAEKFPHFTNGGGGATVSEEEEDLRNVDAEENEKFEFDREDFEGGEDESEGEKEYDQQETVDGGDAAEMYEVEEGERPKLAEGFYEIETVRRKRVRKGQLQYLIKWRGWSEAANTWEPADNLKQCSDIIEAFEESLKSGKSRSTRKRKRQVGITHVPIRRKQHQSSYSAPAYSMPSHARRTAEEPIIPLHMQNESDPANATTENVTENGVKSVPLPVEPEKEQTELNVNGVLEGQAADGNAVTSQEGQVAGGVSSANGSHKPNTAAGPRTGAKKRKSGTVKRFKKDPESSDAPENLADATFAVVEPFGFQQPFFVENPSNGKSKSEDSRNMCNIAQIVKPISCKSTSSNGGEVLLAFEALRSDGTSVTVDNKFLKANNPLLLIDYYEKHLKYCIPE